MTEDTQERVLNENLDRDGVLDAVNEAFWDEHAHILPFKLDRETVVVGFFERKRAFPDGTTCVDDTLVSRITSPSGSWLESAVVYADFEGQLPPIEMVVPRLAKMNAEIIRNAWHQHGGEEPRDAIRAAACWGRPE